MANRLISKIKVKNLFGYYSYSLPEDGYLSEATILYGDNGVGKSTLLQLAFHLLSAANDRGHRTALYKAKFEVLEVDLSSGYKLCAEFSKKMTRKTLSLSIINSDGLSVAVWDYCPADKSFRVQDENFYLEFDEINKRVIKKHKIKTNEVPTRKGQEAYMEVLKSIVPAVYILDADRRLDSDYVADPSDEVELRRLVHMEDARKIKDLVARSRDIALSQALAAASRWIGRKAVQSANRGSENVHTVYANVLRRLSAASGAQTNSLDDSDFSELNRNLMGIEEKTEELACYELATPLSTVEFRKALGTRSKAKKALAADLLDPYVASINSRLTAIDPIYKIVDKFIKTVNGLLSDKSIYFKLSQGFSFKNRLGESLDSSLLSSGEQQLLLLFCYVLVARDDASIFMIDEPEISLNIKWQRQLIQSLLDITCDSNIQFIFASHSMELLSQHRNRVVKLVNRS